MTDHEGDMATVTDDGAPPLTDETVPDLRARREAIARLVASDVPRIRRHLEPGESFCRQDERSTEVAYVVDGAVDVLRSSSTGTLRVGRLGAGALVGELSALLGSARVSTVVTVQPTVIDVFSGDDFTTWLEQSPEAAEAMTIGGRHRMHLAQLSGYLTSLIGDTSEIIQALASVVTWTDIVAGETLFHVGDDADAAYVVVSGRLEAEIGTGDDAFSVEIGRGQLVGEIGVIGQVPRTGTVRAVRDATLARLAASDIETLAAVNPAVLTALFRTILHRSASQGRLVTDRAHVMSVAVTAPVDRRSTVSRVVTEIERHLRTTLVSAAKADQQLGRRGLADAEDDPLGNTLVSAYLHELEVLNDLVVLEADLERPHWTGRSCRQSDALLVIASTDPDESERRAVQRLIDARGERDAPVTIAVVHPKGADRPVGAGWYHAHPDVAEVLHVRQGRAADLERVARLVSGQGVGLALGGGGARGFAHIGLLDALDERGVPIDRVVGSSIGSVMAVLVALDIEPARRIALVTEQFDGLLDYTVPVVSVVKGERITANIVGQMGDWQIEDTWIPYACVSTNLTRSELHVHDEGNLAIAVRASVAIPGVLPPVPFEDDLLVDGGVLNNLPAELLIDDPGIGTIIASDVAPPRGPRAKHDFGLSVSGWSALRSMVRPGKTSYPGITAVLLRSLLVGAVRAQADVLESGQIDLLLQLPLSGVSLLDFEKVEPVATAGRELAEPLLDAWLAERPDLARRR